MMQNSLYKCHLLDCNYKGYTCRMLFLFTSMISSRAVIFLLEPLTEDDLLCSEASSRFTPSPLLLYYKIKLFTVTWLKSQCWHCVTLPLENCLQVILRHSDQLIFLRMHISSIKKQLTKYSSKLPNESLTY